MEFDLAPLKRESVRLIIDLVLAVALGSLVFSAVVFVLVRQSVVLPLPRAGPSPLSPLFDRASSYRTPSRKRGLELLSTITDANTAWLLLRGLKTLGLRMQRHNDNGRRIAEWLEAQPLVRRVWYPLLESHPDHEVAARSLAGGGGVVTFELETDLDGAIRFTDACKLPYIAPSPRKSLT
jgi:hypothetical protein